MKILIPLSVVSLFIASCGISGNTSLPVTPATSSGEIPSTAKALPGYNYPAMPLSEYEALKSNTQSGSSHTGTTQSGLVQSGLIQ